MVSVATIVKSENFQLPQKYDTGISVLTSGTEIEIINDKSKVIAKANSNDIFEISAYCIDQAHLMLGLKPLKDSERLELQKKMIEIIQRNQGLTLNDIKIANNLGLEGKFLKENEQVFFNLSNFSIWINKYKSEIKSEAMKKKLLLQQKAEKELWKNRPIPTEAEQKKMIFEIVNSHILQITALHGKGLSEQIDFLPSILASGGFIFGRLWDWSIHRPIEAVRQEIKANVLLKNPKISPDELKNECYLQAYLEFVKGLQEMGLKLSNIGELISDEV